MDDVTRRALEWLAGDDTGASSKSICFHMLGIEMRDAFGNRPPSDPSDLGRCLRLLAAIPEWKSRMPEMAGVSPQWAAMVARWDEISALMEDEVGIDWSKGERAPRVYAAMRAARNDGDLT